MARQRLIVFFDGTWNDPEDQTNVYRLSRRVHDYDGDTQQRFFYDPGVGTSKWSRFRGGALGYGLSKNLRQGYEWLAKRYTEGDEIWIFGFSRGAYTARSLVGMIRKCGLLHIVTPKLIKDAEALYRNKNEAPDSCNCTQFKEYYSRQPRIDFLGVWDTVGALGVPGTFWSETGKYAWHDTELSGIVDRAYHAVALDEYRAAYDVSLWTSSTGDKKSANLAVEQRWFIGAHANVGGGYGSHDHLADIPLQWMMGKATDAGLVMEEFIPAADAWETNPNDSFRAFLKGAYAWYRKLRVKGDGRFVRKFSEGSHGKRAVNVTIDSSVWRRWRDPRFEYRPQVLTDANQSPLASENTT